MRNPFRDTTKPYLNQGLFSKVGNKARETVSNQPNCFYEHTFFYL